MSASMLLRFPILILLALAGCAPTSTTMAPRIARPLIPGPPIERGQEAQALAVLPPRIGNITRGAEPEVIGADSALIRYSNSHETFQLSATVFLIGLGDNPLEDGPGSPRALEELERGAREAHAQLRATLNPEKAGTPFETTVRRSQQPVMHCRGIVVPLAEDTVNDLLCSTIWRQRLLQIRLTQRHPHEVSLAATLVNHGLIFIIFERLHGDAPNTFRT
ncbi:hypothetical protein ACVFYP_07340 [Roseomonas sp. F4]